MAEILKENQNSIVDGQKKFPLYNKLVFNNKTLLSQTYDHFCWRQAILVTQR